MLRQPRPRQGGFTIVELLIGAAVGVIVVGGAIALYITSVRSSGETVGATRLNQEVSALLSVISNDVRRAGFWPGAVGGNYAQNPFSQADATVLTVVDDLVGDVDQGPTGQGTCLVYAYDATYLAGNTSGVLEAADLFGFRLNGTVVEMRAAGVVDGVNCVGGTCNSCQNGNWEAVTDPDLIEITALTFDLGNSQCLNASEPNGEDDDGDTTIDEIDELNCYVTIPPNASNEATVETREVVVNVTGRLADDTSTQISASQSIKVRNDYLRLR
jgi:type IV pilus assembly protein PilW